jgi:hypothetical protein
MAGDFPETTVAAPRTLILRESVNAVPGPREAHISAAKDGNATFYEQGLRGAIVGAPAVEE